MTLETMQQVVNELVKRGVPATFEYPGHISLVLADPEGTVFVANFGDANEFFGGDSHYLEGGAPTGDDPFESNIPSDTTDYARCADHVAYYYTGAIDNGCRPA